MKRQIESLTALKQILNFFIGFTASESFIEISINEFGILGLKHDYFSTN
jgi:hypothetical protein